MPSDFPYIWEKFLFFFISAAEVVVDPILTKGQNLWYSMYIIVPLRLALSHEANIRGGGKTVHVVFTYLSRSLLQKGVGAGGVSLLPSPLPYTSQLIRGYYIWRRRDRYSPPRSFLHALSSCIGLPHYNAWTMWNPKECTPSWRHKAKDASPYYYLSL